MSDTNESDSGKYQYMWSCMAYTTWVDCIVIQFVDRKSVRIKFYDGLMSDEWIERYVNVDELRKID